MTGSFWHILLIGAVAAPVSLTVPWWIQMRTALCAAGTAGAIVADRRPTLWRADPAKRHTNG